jgi:hypothetical protein
VSPELKAAIDKYITENKVVVFIKGTKQFPQCGFSNTVVQVRVAGGAASPGALVGAACPGPQQMLQRRLRRPATPRSRLAPCP